MKMLKMTLPDGRKFAVPLESVIAVCELVKTKDKDAVCLVTTMHCPDEPIAVQERFQEIVSKMETET